MSSHLHSPSTCCNKFMFCQARTVGVRGKFSKEICNLKSLQFGPLCHAPRAGQKDKCKPWSASRRYAFYTSVSPSVPPSVSSSVPSSVPPTVPLSVPPSVHQSMWGLSEGGAYLGHYFASCARRNHFEINFPSEILRIRNVKWGRKG